MSVDFWVTSLMGGCSPSPVPSCASGSSDEHHEFIKPLDLHTVKHEVPLLKPSPIKQPDYSIQLAQLMMQLQPMQSLLALCQLNAINPFNAVPTTTPDMTETTTSSRKRPLQSSEPTFKRPKLRKLGEDTVTASPVSGMFIKEESTLPPPEELQKEADLLDETAAYVEVSEESRQKIGQIENVIGDCVCCLCKVKYDDVFKLAQHKCPRISHEEYKCPDCDKTFSCPANLASHRRWHKPRDSDLLSCQSCLQAFSSKKQLKAHQSICLNANSLSLLQNIPFPQIVA